MQSSRTCSLLPALVQNRESSYHNLAVDGAFSFFQSTVGSCWNVARRTTTTTAGKVNAPFSRGHRRVSRFVSRTFVWPVLKRVEDVLVSCFAVRPFSGRRVPFPAEDTPQSSVPFFEDGRSRGISSREILVGCGPSVRGWDISLPARFRCLWGIASRSSWKKRSVVPSPRSTGATIPRTPSLTTSSTVRVSGRLGFSWGSWPWVVLALAGVEESSNLGVRTCRTTTGGTPPRCLPPRIFARDSVT